MAAFLASPGQHAEPRSRRGRYCSRWSRASGPEGARERAEAARLIALVPDAFVDLLVHTRCKDPDETVARAAVRSASTITREELVEPLIAVLDREDLVDEATNALSRYGNNIIPVIERHMQDESHGAGHSPRAAGGSRAYRDGRGRAGTDRQPAPGRCHAALSCHRVAEQAAHPPSRGSPRALDHQPAAGRGDRRALPFIPGARSAQANASKTTIPCCRRCVMPWIRSSIEFSG